MANPVSKLILNNTKAPFPLIRTSLLTKPNVKIPKDHPRLLLSLTSTMLDQTPNMGPVHQVPSFLMRTPLFGEESKWVVDKKCDEIFDYDGGTRGLQLELARRKKALEEEEEEEGDFDDTDGRIGGSDDEDWKDEIADDDCGDDEDDGDFDDEDEYDENPRKK